ncbi:MmgE/PrpD family protein [Leisingera sp. M658]|uniref:MmgE/PrpD family protein n=1 Tax=Leisingera sp. M658 TaxID=2867015 RepID=UPI0021A4524B|nr:MmgE/PrpD family protein [Leisingera sp. M658]UWQ75824.1 MmgE/PrpD family protein [Leisingera sp. M658]
MALVESNKRSRKLTETSLGTEFAAGENLAEHFGAWASKLSFEDVPEDALICARRAVLDTIGVIVAGGQHLGVQALAAHGAGSGGASLAVTGIKTDPITAATCNGMAAHVWDFDDNSYTGMIHGSAIILPAVLAVAQSVDASEKDLLQAFVIGSEVSYALGEICTHSHFMQGWWATGSCALIGTVAGVARLLGLNAEQTANAIGTAAVTAGIERAIAGTDAKPYLVGNVAGQAITLARAAQAGLTGPKDAFEQKNGFFSLLNQGISKREGICPLAERWRVQSPGLLFKTSPVCSAAHAAIEAASLLTREATKPLAEVVAIEAEVPKLVSASLVYDRPVNPQQAQFSLPYSVACAMLHGSVRLQDLSAAELADDAKQWIMDRVTTRICPELSAEPMASDFPESTRVTFKYADGVSRTHFCGEAFGMPNRPLSNGDLIRKFNECLNFAGLAQHEIDLQTVDLLELAAKVLWETAA